MHLANMQQFNAKTIITTAALVLFVANCFVYAQQSADGCKTECYPNTKLINGKGISGKGENCRWIMRTDGKPARLCDHIKCRRVCPNQTTQAAEQAEASASSDNAMRIEQQLGDENGTPISDVQPMGIMRHLHGSKMSKAIVPGVAGGRLASGSAGSAPVSAPASPALQQPISGARRMAPTLPPAVQYDENDTPPPIARFLDISPEE